jgi:hypothetical protein
MIEQKRKSAAAKYESDIKSPTQKVKEVVLKPAYDVRQRNVERMMMPKKAPAKQPSDKSKKSQSGDKLQSGSKSKRLTMSSGQFHSPKYAGAFPSFDMGMKPRKKKLPGSSLKFGDWFKF